MLVADFDEPKVDPREESFGWIDSILGSLFPLFALFLTVPLLGVGMIYGAIRGDGPLFVRGLMLAFGVVCVLFILGVVVYAAKFVDEYLIHWIDSFVTAMPNARSRWLAFGLVSLPFLVTLSVVVALVVIAIVSDYYSVDVAIGLIPIEVFLLACLWVLRARTFTALASGIPSIMLEGWPAECSPQADRIETSIVHFSDLHVGATDADTLLGSRRRSCGNHILRVFLAEHASTLARAHYIAVTGDITDRGTGPNWRAFRELTKHWREQPRGPRILLVPGNHDINVPVPRVLIGEMSERIRRSVCLIRFMGAMLEYMGDVAHVQTSKGLQCLDEFLAPHTERLLRFVSEPPRRNSVLRPAQKSIPDGPGVEYVDVTSPETVRERAFPHQLWEELFPLTVFDRERDLRFVILDSVRPASSLADNAIGHVGDAQLARLGRIMEINVPTVVLLHHHIVLPSTSFAGRFMTLLNGRKLVDVLPRDRSVLILHGHRHVSYRRTLQGHLLASARSTTLGSRSQGLPPAFNVFHIETQQQSVRIRSVEECKLAGPNR